MHLRADEIARPETGWKPILMHYGEFERCFPGNLTVVPGVLDMEHFDAIFVPVDEAEIIPPCFDVVLGGWRLFSTEIDPSNVREGIE